jgi:zinc protease
LSGETLRTLRVNLPIFDVGKRDSSSVVSAMPKATPLILVLILGVLAASLSIHSSRQPPLATVSSAVERFDAQLPQEPATKDVAPPIMLATAKPWPQESSDIAPDSGAIFGSLPNGLRYLIYPNSEPPKRVSMRLHIATGSLMEAEDQRGLAHFLEHMVFNGTKNYAASDIVPRMQRLGIAFGAHANAYTSFDETVYMLDLPDLSADTMKLGFSVMRDFGDGALLSEEEIDKERGVILSEKVSRDTVSSRLQEQQFSKLLPDSLVAKRFPIGKEEVIQSAKRERFMDYYSRYYTPQRMTFIVVGDSNPIEMKAEIERAFQSMTQPVDAGEQPDLGPIRQPEGTEASVFADPELASTEVSLVLVRPMVLKPDTAANRAEELPLNIAHSIISRRFERLAQTEGSAIATGSIAKNEVFNYVEIGSLDVTAADDRWQEAVPVVEQELRRAIQYGFTTAEIIEAKAKILNQYEQQVKQKATRKSERLATALASAINDNTVFSDPVTDLALVQKALDSIESQDCHHAFVKFWEAPGYHLTLTTKVKPENGEKDLAALFEESRGKPVSAPQVRAMTAFGYTDFGSAGRVVSRKDIKDLGITQLVLSNQVHVNLKSTDFEKGKIKLLARIGSGKLTQPQNMPMLDVFAASVFEDGGLGKHSNDELKEILAGKNVGTTLAVADDYFTLSGATTPIDFMTQVQLMCASLTDPGYREEALWQFKKAAPMLEQKLKHTPAGPMQAMDAWLNGNDTRFATATPEKLLSYTLDDAKNWLTPELTKGYLELSIVGDFEIDEILPQVLTTFGALPMRARTVPPLAELRKIEFPNAPASKTFTYDSKISQAIATTIWKTAGLRGNMVEFRRLNLLGEIYGDRLREEIREKLGASYSPNAGASGSDGFDGFGYLIGQSIGKPKDLELLLKTMRNLAEELASKGATLKPTLGQLEKSLRDNSYWLNTVMSQSQLEPQRLDLARSRDQDYKSISLPEINALAKKYLGGANALLISIKNVSE